MLALGERVNKVPVTIIKIVMRCLLNQNNVALGKRVNTVTAYICWYFTIVKIYPPEPELCCAR